MTVAAGLSTHIHATTSSSLLRHSNVAARQESKERTARSLPDIMPMEEYNRKTKMVELSPTYEEVAVIRESTGNENPFSCQDATLVRCVASYICRDLKWHGRNPLEIKRTVKQVVAVRRESTGNRKIANV
jgi:hypothetical protein